MSPEIRDAVFAAADTALATTGHTGPALEAIVSLLERPDMERGHLSAVFLRWCAWVRVIHPAAGLPFFHGAGGVIGPDGTIVDVDDAPAETRAAIWCLRFLVAYLNDDTDMGADLYAVMIGEREFRLECLVTLLTLCANTISGRSGGLEALV